MNKRRLGRSDTFVSELCLGSMTWGTQNTYAEAAEQIECAIDHGVNFIDTAEMYPTTPLTEKTLGDTEAIIGQWFKDSGRRDDIVIATKVTGNGKAWMYDCVTPLKEILNHRCYPARQLPNMASQN